jgi:chemotaxis protein CheZ
VCVERRMHGSEGGVGSSSREAVRAYPTEIAALGAEEISVNHIPSATDELDAIVAHTASATDIILEACEMLDRLGGELTKDTSAAHAAEAAAQLQNATMRIYEACSFQDITGQRITKVVATLKTIETKVAGIVTAFGGRGEPAKAPARVNGTTPPNAMVLHGPQLPDVAMHQSDIDKLLASFE